MYILGDIGNSESKVFLVNSKNKVIEEFDELSLELERSDSNKIEEEYGLKDSQKVMSAQEIKEAFDRMNGDNKPGDPDYIEIPDQVSSSPNGIFIGNVDKAEGFSGNFTIIANEDFIKFDTSDFGFVYGTHQLPSCTKIWTNKT